MATLLLGRCSVISAKRPNVVIIFADDVGTGDVPGYWDNSGVVNMPNLESLLDHGTTFTDAHSTPLCAPSRYVLLSGNYQHRGTKFGGSWAVNYEGNQFRERQKSIARVLRDNDYATAIFGKWHLGGKVPLAKGATAKVKATPSKEFIISDIKHDWTKPMEQGPWDIGFQNSYVTLAGVQNPPYVFLRNNTVDMMDLNRVKFWPTGNYSMPQGVSKIDSPGEGHEDWDSSAYNMIVVNETEKFIDDHLRVNASQPFFAYVALGAVHIPHSPPDKYLDGTPIAGQHETPHMDVLSEVDKVVGSLIQKLEEKKVLEDTLIIFTSDNGGLDPDSGSDGVRTGHYSGGPLRAEKASIYEGGHRIPMTFRWDNGNIPKGEKRSHYVGLSDIFTTLCDLLDIDVPPRQAIDSVSFADYMYNETATEGLRSSLGMWSFVKHQNSFRLGQEAVRVGSMKLIHDYQNNTFELYDLDNDVSESKNLISDASEEMIQDMYDELKKIGPCHDAPGKFYVRKRKKKFSCQWFGRKNTWNRCGKHAEGWINCRLTCALRSSKQCKTIGDLS